jgi:GDP-L-fucose synthase
VTASRLFSLEGKKVLIAGHRGMVGSALVRRLASERCEIQTLGRHDADLRRQTETEAVMARFKPHAVFVASGLVGGILANSTRPAEFIYDNLMIAVNIIEAARQTGVQKLLFLGSSCIYPRMAKQPIAENELLGGPLEPTNQWYAVAKIAGLKLCAANRRQYGCDFISVQPTNLYGPGDNYDLLGSHVIPALIAKMHAAKVAGNRQITIWGTGTPRREFLHVNDLADALVYLMECYSDEEHINVGWGEDISIAEVASVIAKVIGFNGDVVFDTSKPDGPPRKLLETAKLNAMGWKPKIGLNEGLADAYRWYLENKAG